MLTLSVACVCLSRYPFDASKYTVRTARLLRHKNRTTPIPTVELPSRASSKMPGKYPGKRKCSNQETPYYGTSLKLFVSRFGKLPPQGCIHDTTTVACFFNDAPVNLTTKARDRSTIFWWRGMISMPCVLRSDDPPPPSPATAKSAKRRGVARLLADREADAARVRSLLLEFNGPISTLAR